MYFEKGNNKKNRKITFSITLAIIILFAATVVISISVVTKYAFAADPITNCFIANAIINPSYFQAEQNFVNSLPNDKLFTKLSAEVGNGPIQNNAELYALLTNPNINHQNKDNNRGDMEFEIANLLAAAGFAPLQQNGINKCIGFTD
jgi:hypothetical protein